MEDDNIKKILTEIEAANPQAFDSFASSHPKCFQVKKGNWLFPMLFNYYSSVIKDEYIISLIIELGMSLHNSIKDIPMSQITKIDKSLCIDDSFVEDFILEIQKAQNPKSKLVELNSPWRTRGISMAINEIDTLMLNSIIFKYKDKEHPYILADIAATYVYSQKFNESLNYLYRSVKLLTKFPNRFWNSDYGIAGATNTFRLLLLMCPSSKIDLYKKLYIYDYIYLTKLSCTTNIEEFQQNAFVNRASIELNHLARHIIPFYINPDLLYISDMYYAHYCNEIAEQISYASGWRYNMKSLTFYQHASLWPNATGGYAEIEDKTYSEIVAEKHEQAKQIAFDFYLQILNGNMQLNESDIESLFKIIQQEIRNDYKAIRNRVLNFKNY